MESFLPASHRILVVDDTQANRRLYGSLLEKEGFVVQTAEDGIEALECIAETRPDLVLLDYMMPRMDGLEVLERLRGVDATKRLPVVMLTASAEPDHVDAALAAGASDYITKPVNGKLLLTRVKSIIAAGQAKHRSASSERASAAIEELEEAARVQQAQLPDMPTRFRDWRITGAVAPSGQVGGDIFDVVTTEDGRYVAFLLDVAGHGTASALVAAETRAEMRTLLTTRSLLDSVRSLNSRMAKRQTSKYSCLAAIELSGTQVRAINLGLPPLVLLRGGHVEASVWGSGLPIGMFDDASYEISEFSMQAGDRIVLVSDGLTEPFGRADDTLAAIHRLGLWPSVKDDVPEPGRLRSRIISVLQTSLPSLRDDATALVLHLTGSVQEVLQLAARPAAIPRAVRWAVDQSPSWADKVAVDHGLTEALTNAVLHGALGLGSEIRADSSGDGYLEYLALAEELPDRPGFLDRHVELRVLSNPECFGIRIAWQGAPCPPEVRAPRPASEETEEFSESGMGLKIIDSLFHRVEWDDDGFGLELWMDRAEPGPRPTP